jgi:hypothetical protein
LDEGLLLWIINDVKTGPNEELFSFPASSQQAKRAFRNFWWNRMELATEIECSNYYFYLALDTLLVMWF